MASLVIKFPDGTEQEQELGDQLTIGRAEGNDLVLAEGGVSRKHARFFLQDGGVMVEDVGSANGTWIDGEKIDGPSAVGPKATVVVGDYEIRLKVGAKPRPAAARGGPAKGTRGETKQAMPRAAQAAPRATRVMPVVKAPASGAALAKRPKPTGTAKGPTLRGLTGAVTGQAFPLTGTLVVGRVAGVDIRLDDDSVSRRHAEVELAGQDVVVRDLGSANGTSINGAPIEGEALLQNGDIVQFGVVELMYESGSGSARAPVRRGASGPNASARPSRGARERDPERHSPTEQSSVPPNPGKKRLLIVGGAVAALLFVAVAAKALLPGPKPVGPGPGGQTGPRKPPKKPTEQIIEEGLAECRSYASAEQGLPDWKRAEGACKKVLDEDPINAEANQLLKRIQLEATCQQNLKLGQEAAGQNRFDEALELLGKVKPECPTYFLKALAAAKEPMTEAKKRSGEECKTYASNGKWENALKRCEAYSRLACQTMAPDELYPPAMTRLSLEGGLGRNDWRPKDTLYLNFLKARARLKPGEPPWQCPDLPAFRPPPPPPDPRRFAKEEFVKRYPEKGMGEALSLYFDGNFQEAVVPLQKILENVGKAALHDQAKTMMLDIENVKSLFTTGMSSLNDSKVEKAEEPFRKALALDEKMVLAEKTKLPEDQRRHEIDKRASHVRRSIVDVMGSNCYSSGKALADRKDFRAACRLWKLGISFNRANSDILKAATYCTQRAQKALEQADSCEGYKSVLDFAVDGDGFADEAKKKMTDLDCN